MPNKTTITKLINWGPIHVERSETKQDCVYSMPPMVLDLSSPRYNRTSMEDDTASCELQILAYGEVFGEPARLTIAEVRILHGQITAWLKMQGER